MKGWLASGAAVTVAAALTLPAAGGDPQTRLSLPQLVDLAVEHNADVGVGRWKVSGARSRLAQARAAYVLPRLRLETFGGLVPDAAGDILDPPGDTTGVRDLGPFVRAELEFAQPLYTFGLLDNLEEAAAAGVEVEEAALVEARLDVARRVTELYYGLLLAQDLSDLARRLRVELEPWQDEVDAEDPDIPLSAPYKLRLALLQLDSQERELVDKRRLAQAALAYEAGLPEGAAFELADDWLVPVSNAVPAREDLFSLAVAHRPDWRRLRSGIAARRAQERAARSSYYPQVFLSGGVRYAVAPGRTDQHNPFVKDDFNLFNGGVFLGLRQSLELGVLGAEVDRARAERFQLEARERSALQGIRLDLERTHDEFLRAGADLESAGRARALTREWAQRARDEYQLDPAQLKELVTAFEALASSEEAYYRAVYDYNVGFAHLERVVGTRLPAAGGAP